MFDLRKAEYFVLYLDTGGFHMIGGPNQIDARYVRSPGLAKCPMSFKRRLFSILDIDTTQIHVMSKFT